MQLITICPKQHEFYYTKLINKNIDRNRRLSRMEQKVFSKELHGTFGLINTVW